MHPVEQRLLALKVLFVFCLSFSPLPRLILYIHTLEELTILQRHTEPESRELDYTSKPNSCRGLLISGLAAGCSFLKLKWLCLYADSQREICEKMAADKHTMCFAVHTVCVKVWCHSGGTAVFRGVCSTPWAGKPCGLNHLIYKPGMIPHTSKHWTDDLKQANK